jgi:hypothetical protein
MANWVAWGLEWSERDDTPIGFLWGQLIPGKKKNDFELIFCGRFLGNRSFI